MGEWRRRNGSLVSGGGPAVSRGGQPVNPCKIASRSPTFSRPQCSRRHIGPIVHGAAVRVAADERIIRLSYHPAEAHLETAAAVQHRVNIGFNTSLRSTESARCFRRSRAANIMPGQKAGAGWHHAAQSSGRFSPPSGQAGDRERRVLMAGEADGSV